MLSREREERSRAFAVRRVLANGLNLLLTLFLMLAVPAALGTPGKPDVGWLPPSGGEQAPDTVIELLAASPEAALYLDQVQEVYIAYYQRPADPAGMVWWAGRLAESGGNLTAIIDAFANSQESRDLYGEINAGTVGSVIASMYQALFNRDPDPVGLDFYTSGFNAGTFTPGTIALNILDGAINDDAYAIDNKRRASNLFSRMLDPNLTGDDADLRATNYRGLPQANAARAFLVQVTAETDSFPTSAEIEQFVRDHLANPGDPILAGGGVPPVVGDVGSASGGSLLSTSGTEVGVRPGAVSPHPDGSPASTSLSIESNLPAEQWPAPIPDGYQLVGGVHLVGPAGFVFADPVQVWLPAEGADSPAGLVVLWFDEAGGAWMPLLSNEIDPAQRRLGASVLQLGYFAVARSPFLEEPAPVVQQLLAYDAGAPAAISPASVGPRVGGIRMVHEHTPEYYYYLTVARVTYSYPEVGWPNLVGYNVSTGSEPTGGPRGTTWMMNIPQGLYGIIVSRQRAGTQMSLPGPMETYNQVIDVSVGPYTSVAGGWGFQWQLFSGWTDLNLPAGEWFEGGPDDWPEPTTPYGTGHLNVTLEWENLSDSWADLDLHLYGPDAMHVYYAIRTAPDGALELDRDWQDELGSARENIYSTGTMPSGDYRIAVHHYTGDTPKSFTVRVKLGTSVQTYRMTATQYWQSQDVRTFSLP